MKNSSSPAFGTLFVVATPIGNLQDISLRAIATLKEVDAIVAEDTRHSKTLLNTLNIKKPLISLHDHNEKEKSKQLIEQLQAGRSFALISDAGTPLISDPGFVLVRQARAAGVNVTPIPGACAVITALCAAGIACDTFFFAGFLPAKPQARLKQLQTFFAQRQTVVAYESTHRIIACLEDIAHIFGVDYELVLAKELTKAFEQFIQAPAKTIIQWLNGEKGRVKGEFVLILPAAAENVTAAVDKELLSKLLTILPLKQAVQTAALLTDTAKNELYQLALAIQRSTI